MKRRDLIHIAVRVCYNRLCYCVEWHRWKFDGQVQDTSPANSTSLHSFPEDPGHSLLFALFVLFSSGSLLRNAENGGHGVDPKSPANADVWTIFAALTFLGCLLVLSNVGVSVTIERDWATSIAQGSSKRLARLNAILRRIDLICKLVAPLLVSLLTTTISLSRTCIVLMTLSAATMCLEAFLIGVVFSRFSILRDEQHLLLVAKEQKSISMNNHANRLESRAGACEKYRRMIMEIFTLWLTRQYNDWRTFAVMPIFISEWFYGRKKLLFSCWWNRLYFNFDALHERSIVRLDLHCVPQK